MLRLRSTPLPVAIGGSGVYAISLYWAVVILRTAANLASGKKDEEVPGLPAAERGHPKKAD